MPARHTEWHVGTFQRHMGWRHIKISKHSSSENKSLGALPPTTHPIPESGVRLTNPNP
jgi:hypothetical protein